MTRHLLTWNGADNYCMMIHTVLIFKNVRQYGFGVHKKQSRKQTRSACLLYFLRAGLPGWSLQKSWLFQSTSWGNLLYRNVTEEQNIQLFSSVKRCAQFYKDSCWNVNYTKIIIVALTYARRKTQSSHNLFLEITAWRKDLHTTYVFPFFDTCQFITINTTNYCDDTWNDRFNSHLTFKNILIMMMPRIFTFAGCCVCHSNEARFTTRCSAPGRRPSSERHTTCSMISTRRRWLLAREAIIDQRPAAVSPLCHGGKWVCSWPTRRKYQGAAWWCPCTACFCLLSVSACVLAEW